MILRNPREGMQCVAPENIFEAVEPRSGNVMGRCIVTEEFRPLMFPDRPYQVRLDIDGGDETLDTLLGASLARARALCSAQKEAARIYAGCDPADSALLDTLRQYGFRDNDGLMRLRMRLPGYIDAKLPMGCVAVYDRLEDVQEQKYFLERYNELYGSDMDMAWLSTLRKKEGFCRILTVAPTGMAGEVVVWREDNCGVVEFFNTARRWRDMGVAGCMLALACRFMKEKGCDEAVCDVRARMPIARHVLEKTGFEPDVLIMRYPGIDV